MSAIRARVYGSPRPVNFAFIKCQVNVPCKVWNGRSAVTNHKIEDVVGDCVCTRPVDSTAHVACDQRLRNGIALTSDRIRSRVRAHANVLEAEHALCRNVEKCVHLSRLTPELSRPVTSQLLADATAPAIQLNEAMKRVGVPTRKWTPVG
jgi:hypothetical protein